MVPTGRYVVVAPPQIRPDEKLATLVFFHGWSDSPAGILALTDVVDFVAANRMLLVLPEGKGQTWSHPGSPGRYRDEIVFVGEVLDDLARRFPVDRARLWASGFSQGGSMVWTLACAMPERFAAFAPIAGGFWEPLPKACKPAPTRIFHVHGITDTMVPMTGRSIGGSYRQGDIRKGWTILRAANGCGVARSSGRQGRLTCEPAADCPGAAAMTLCLHSGDHEMAASFLSDAWTWIKALPPAAP